MNETIGKKGGANDRRRALRIKQIQKEKLQQHQEEKEIRDLEAKLRKQKRYILIRSLPIIVAGGVVKSFYTTLAYKKERENEEDNFVILPNEDKEDEVEEFTIPKKKKDLVVVITDRPETAELSTSKAKKRKKKRLPKVKEEPIVKEETDDSVKENHPIGEIKQKIDEKEGESVKAVETQTPPPIIPINPVVHSEIPPVIPVIPIESKREIPSSTVEMLEPVENGNILDNYEKRFKDIRYELRKVLFEYYVIEKEEGKVSSSMQADVLLERLNVVIRKIGELKEQLTKMTTKMNDAEIYQFINNCLVDFQDENAEVKDSPLYISIAEKIEEIDQKKDRLKKKVEEKKKLLETKEQNFEQLKKKYAQFEEFSQIISDLKETQEELLKEIQEKVENAVSIEKKVEIKLKYMNDQSSRILRMLALSMMIPGFHSAKGLSLATLTYLNFMNQLLHPQIEKKEYEVIQVTDYTNMIEDDIHSIESVQNDISGVNEQLERTIKEVEEQFKDYAGIFPECNQLLFNLNKMKSNLEEKEYEMEKIKGENVKELEKNKEKILERVEKPL